MVFSLFAITLWIAFSATINSSQFGDNIEQFNWAHGPQWGYWKHPPLPTLMMAGMIALFGNSVYWAYCLSALCFMGTAFFTWKIAVKLLGAHAAAVTVILLSLHMGFSWRAQIYNHNTVMLLLISAIVWNSFLAAESKSLWRWVLTGVLSGLALLTKYQAVVPLLGILFALQRAGALKQKHNLVGIGLVVLTASAVFSPHLSWLIANDFPTVRYAQHSAQNLDAVGRLKSLVSFIATQIRFYLPALLTLGLVIGYFKFRNRAGYTDRIDLRSPLLSAWMWGLIGFPAIFVGLMALVAGVHLEGHWGLQTFQFACVLLVWRCKPWIERISLLHFLIAAALVHGLMLGFYNMSTASTGARASLKSGDRVYPAAAVAEQATLDWQKVTQCPLKYVVGPAFEGGLIALYSGKFPAVQEEGDPAKSPWIKPSELDAHGAIQVWIRPDQAPAGVTADGAMTVPGRGHESVPQKVYWHVLAPKLACTASG